MLTQEKAVLIKRKLSRHEVKSEVISLDRGFKIIISSKGMYFQVDEFGSFYDYNFSGSMDEERYNIGRNLFKIVNSSNNILGW